MPKVKTAAWLWLLAIAVAASAAVREVNLAWRRLERPLFGPARWIWDTYDVHRPHEVAFTAVRRFSIAEPIRYADATIFVDRRYRFFLDGRLVGEGGQRPGDRADRYDLAGRFPEGAHEVAIEAESPTGIGGILFTLELSGHGRFAVVSDGRWTVGGRPVWVWGAPPMYPWGFPADPVSRAAQAGGFLREGRPGRM